MGSLLVRNVDDKIINALKARAGEQGVSAEAAHRHILEAALLSTPKRPIAEVLLSIPSAGKDEDFERIQTNRDNNVFD